MREDQSPKAVLFDFDGTISTLRSGWEQVMRPLMLEMLDPEATDDAALGEMVDAYINASTGVQTIFQMEWLRDQVVRHGKNPSVLDPWDYKDEYNRRLMDVVARRVEDVRTGRVDRARYLVSGSVELLEALREKGIALYVASGTDDADVKREAAVLGLADCFQHIAGAPYRRADCSKESVLRSLLKDGGIAGEELVVVGDGRVEIALGREIGARTLGVASDEEKRRGINPVKQARLEKAGADWIVGDFSNTKDILAWMRV